MVSILIVILILLCCYVIIYQLWLLAVINKDIQTIRLVRTSSRPVSIVVCARNELENLKVLMPLLLQQKYPSFEIVLADDGSDDGTATLIQQYPDLTYVRIPPEEKVGLGKKYALQKGIDAAKNEIILLTDADCRPASVYWLTEMTNPLQDGKDIVLGISPYRTPHSLLGALVAYETAQTALQYTGYAIAGMPYMSVGRNVCYRKTLLQTKRWNAQELNIASGDDDLMIQSLANGQNTTVCFSPSGYTYSKSAATFREWFRQKLRHYESGALYQLKHQWLLGSVLIARTIAYLLFICIGIAGLISGDFPSLFWPVFWGYTLLLTITQGLLHNMLSLNKYWPLALFFDFLYFIFTVVLGLLSRYKSTVNWK